jgi:hypothetical protein
MSEISQFLEMQFNTLYEIIGEAKFIFVEQIPQKYALKEKRKN